MTLLYAFPASGVSLAFAKIRQYSFLWWSTGGRGFRFALPLVNNRYAYI
ncbi:MAG: hypothetical protein WBV67_06885 [Candidatus Cybelea sp.]